MQKDIKLICILDLFGPVLFIIDAVVIDYCLEQTGNRDTSAAILTLIPVIILALGSLPRIFSVLYLIVRRMNLKSRLVAYRIRLSTSILILTLVTAGFGLFLYFKDNGEVIEDKYMTILIGVYAVFLFIGMAFDFYYSYIFRKFWMEQSNPSEKEYLVTGDQSS